MTLFSYCLFYLWYHWDRITFLAQAVLLMMPEAPRA
jgi:hypothetical protein